MRSRVKTITLYLSIGIGLPFLLLLCSFIIPEPYSHPFVEIAISPTNFIPLFENKELLEELTIMIYGHMTTNYAPISILLLNIFWFFASIFTFYLLRWVCYKCKP